MVKQFYNRHPEFISGSQMLKQVQHDGIISSLSKHLLSLLQLLIVSVSINAQQTVGLFTNETGNLDGYVLFSPTPSMNAYLIDKCGKLVHTWNTSYRPGLAVYLLEDGSLLRTGNSNNMTLNAGGSGGVIQKIDWDGNVTWSYTISSSTECQHHDAYPMPNGNILAIVWEVKTNTEAIAEGRNPSQTNTTVWSEKIVELQPGPNNTATIVWEWHAWDHLVQDYDSQKNNYGVVADHPELIDINFSATSMNSDWLHINSVHYNPELDQILLSNHNFSEIWIIDHSTTTAEAASHSGGNLNKGGDLLYRWGNPVAYDRGTPANKKLYAQHNATWITPGYPDENKIMIYNNGQGRPGDDYSSVEVIEPPLENDNSYSITSGQAYLPTASTWTYTAPNPTDFYSSNISGAQRLSNGNTMVCEGSSGRFFEVDENDAVVWEYVNPVQLNGPASQGTVIGNNATFRCTLYEPSYAAFTGRDLTPGDPIELNPLTYTCDMVTGIETAKTDNSEITLFPNPATNLLHFKGNVDAVSIYNLSGQLLIEKELDKEQSISIENLASGNYVIRLKQGTNSSFQHFIKE